jgi:hypothetical protein
MRGSTPFWRQLVRTKPYLRYELTHIADYPVNWVADLLPWNVTNQLSSDYRGTT